MCKIYLHYLRVLFLTCFNSEQYGIFLFIWRCKKGIGIMEIGFFDFFRIWRFDSSLEIGHLPNFMAI